MKIPSLEEAKQLLAEAEKLNHGPWIAHSIHVAEAAKYIADLHPNLDGDVAHILGYLHDIGRREGVTDLRHILDGYRFLQRLGYTGSAKLPPPSFTGIAKQRVQTIGQLSVQLFYLLVFAFGLLTLLLFSALHTFRKHLDLTLFACCCLSFR